MMTFHEKLKALARNQNKAALARSAGLPESTISSYMCKPDSLPRVDIGLKIARALDVSAEWLFDDSQDMPPVPAAGAEPPACITPDDHARQTIRHGADVLQGEFLYLALRGVSDAIAQQAIKGQPPQ